MASNRRTRFGCFAHYANLQMAGPQKRGRGRKRRASARVTQVAPPGDPRQNCALANRGRSAEVPVETAARDLPLLAIRALSMRFGGVVALDGVSFEIAAGQICGLIGPNGAGKTTLFNCMSRLYEPDSGSIAFDGRSLLREPRH